MSAVPHTTSVASPSGGGASVAATEAEGALRATDQPQAGRCSPVPDAQSPVPSSRSSLSVLSAIDAFNAALGDLKLRAARVLIAIAEQPEADPIERRRCASALVRAPFERYPNAASIDGPADDFDDDEEDDPGPPPPSAPDDMMRAYDHGYWSGFATKPWPRPPNIIEHIKNVHACHGHGRESPLPPPGTDPGPHTANPPPPPLPPLPPPPARLITYASRATDPAVSAPASAPPDSG